MFYMSLFNFSEEVASKLTFSEKIEAILTTGIGGYLLVFAVLALIWFILAIFGKAFDKKDKKPEEAPKAAAVTPAPIPEPVAPAPTEQDDTAIVAAIVAAISAYTGKPAGGFKVVSFRKKH